MLMLINLIGCKNLSQEQEAKQYADQLLEDISKGTALKDFPVEIFPPSQTLIILNDLKNKCDFANRKGNFVNDFYRKKPGGIDQVSFIYEYYLKCDSIRFILTYNLDNKIELFNFKMEPIEKDNPMITKPENRLKFKK
ncbi:MAG: hypothetical protein JWQ57_230 [Mucilaginibacter sp.]|nr:hypothetical protein [Mucilaginibacter sp.]